MTRKIIIFILLFTVVSPFGQTLKGEEIYSNGVSPSKLSPTEWIKSNEYIPPKSNAVFPVDYIVDRCKDLKGRQFKTKLFLLSERYKWTDEIVQIKKNNPDSILAFVLSINSKKNRKTSFVDLHFFDEKNYFIADLVDFYGSPSRIYFNTNYDETTISTFGSSLGLKIKKEENNNYSMSWKEFELVIGCVCFYAKETENQ